MARTSKPVITAADILAHLDSPAAPASSDDSLTDKFVGWTANRIDATATGVARIFGAAQASGKNFDAHRKLEHAVQTHRSQQRLAAAAERAARILNS